MAIPLWVFAVLVVVLAGLLLRSRGRRGRLDPHFLPAHLYAPVKQTGFSHLLKLVVWVLVALCLIWFLLNVEFGGQVVRIVL